ncbi:Crp/Fnr family transcriptional regulator [Parerythrobacter aestuarii]|uniref:Crp/Fnr family transcriptional regulator n=1 Tax=Parerythrobacter aestuarii TaxID=3020909 RepID=UPI0024DE15CE|nr:Crp/Fnr family transcriptional regulator [Parerythrobacter aestuarii]
MSNIEQLETPRQGRSLASPTLFGLLEPELQAELREAAPLRRFASGQLIQQRGEESNGFWLIESGAVVVGQYLPDGDFRAVAHLQPGDSYGELAWLAGRARVVDAVAKTASTVRWIEGARYEALLARSPEAMRRLLGGLAEELQEMIDLVAGQHGGTGLNRIAHLLRNLSATGPVITLGQQELGDLAGVTRVTANGALKELEAAGCITRGYRRITVTDRARLADWT